MKHTVRDENLEEVARALFHIDYRIGQASLCNIFIPINLENEEAIETSSFTMVLNENSVDGFAGTIQYGILIGEHGACYAAVEQPKTEVRDLFEALTFLCSKGPAFTEEDEKVLRDTEAFFVRKTAVLIHGAPML